MNTIKPKEEPVLLERVNFPRSVAVQDVMGNAEESSYSPSKGWVVELYPKARIIRVWSAALARRKPAQVTTFALDGGTYWQAKGDTEHEEQPSLHAAR